MPTTLSLTFIPRLASPTRVDRARSRRLGDDVAAVQGHAFTNGLRALELVPDAVYVEGFVVVENILQCQLEHAWLETAEGVVLDPSPRFHEEGAPNVTYFPVFRWTPDEVAALLEANGEVLTTPLAQYRGNLGKREIAWRDAALAAARHRSALTLAETGRPDFYGDGERQVLRAVLGTYWVDGPGSRDPRGDVATHGSRYQ